MSSGNLVPSPSTENHLLSLSELADRKISTFGKFCHISQMSTKICPRMYSSLVFSIKLLKEKESNHVLSTCEYFYCV